MRIYPAMSHLFLNLTWNNIRGRYGMTASWPANSIWLATRKHALQWEKVWITQIWKRNKKQDIKDTTNYTGLLKNQIGEKQCIQDLGIMINSTLTFSDHITKVCNKSNQMCGWIQRIFKTRNQKSMWTLWNSLAQPHLDYCSQLWAQNWRNTTSRSTEKTHQ